VVLSVRDRLPTGQTLLRRLRVGRETLREDAIAGLVLGVQSVPDSLATGLLAIVNPTAGLNAYLAGTLTGAIFTSSAFMAVQATGAMAMIVADIPAVHDAADPERALFTLSVLTGIVMLSAGLLKLGSALRFVSNAVLVGFINAVGVNIVLGQLANFTGYAANGPNRVVRAVDTLLHPAQIDGPTFAVGVATIVLILLLERTRLGALGLVVAIAATSAMAVALGWHDVANLNSLGDVPDSLPRPVLPDVRLVPELMVPAVSLAFVGLVQGAGISANYPNPDGSYPNVSRDFVGQGAANIAAGIFQGMPVGGSLSASALNKAAGARSRQSLLITSVVIAIVIVAFGRAVGFVSMPALAGLLMVIGFRTIKPADLELVWRAGDVQKIVLVVTFALTMLIPLQFAVLVGVGASVVLHVIRQSNKISIRRWELDPQGNLIETDPPRDLPPNDVVVLQPYGSLFFASAPIFEAGLPTVTDVSSNSVVILRLRGRSDLGSTFIKVLYRYAESLARVRSRLVIVGADEHLRQHLTVSGVASLIDASSIYTSDDRVGASVRRAYDEALDWVDGNR
jgi:SulP family sulfate permease